MQQPPRDTQKHWETVWQSGTPGEKSWFQETPTTSISLIDKHSQTNGPVVDIGAGTSTLVDYLAAQHREVTLVDVSQQALELVQDRLGTAQEHVSFVCSDLLDWTPQHEFDLWHDRAVLHFLSETHDVQRYVELASQSVASNGLAIIGGFAPNGPEQCSGLEVVRRGVSQITELFGASFSLVASEHVLHTTPWGATQAFVFVVLRKNAQATPLLS